MLDLIINLSLENITLGCIFFKAKELEEQMLFRNESLFQKFLSVLPKSQHNHKFTKCVMRKFTHSSSQQSKIKFIKVDEPSSIVHADINDPFKLLRVFWSMSLVDLTRFCSTISESEEWVFLLVPRDQCQFLYASRPRGLLGSSISSLERERDLIIIGTVA